MCKLNSANVYCLAKLRQTLHPVGWCDPASSLGMAAGEMLVGTCCEYLRGNLNGIMA